MTKQELIEKVASTPGLPPELTKKLVGTLVDAVFAELGDYFVKAKVTRRQTPRFTYPGFGTFTKKRKNGRRGRNPRTGEPIAIPPSTTVSFAPGQELKGFLNRTPLKSQG
jgi:nucleoid DNA-binding protein